MYNDIPEPIVQLKDETADYRNMLLGGIRERLRQRTPVDAPSMLRKDQGNVLLRSFIENSIVPTFALYARAAAYDDSAFAAIATAQLSAIDLATQELCEARDNVVNFRFQPGQDDALQRTTARMMSAINRTWAVVAPALALLDGVGLSSERTRLHNEYEAVSARSAKLEEEIGAAEAKARDYLHEAADAKREAESALKLARETAASSGVLLYADAFRKAADEHEASAGGWLYAAVGCAVVLLAWAFAALFCIPFKSDAAGWHQAGAKIVITSVLSYALVWCTRSYRAHLHNAVVARHRLRALTTFERFVAAAQGDDATKHAVLTAAMQTAFAPQATGYSDVDMPAPTVTNVVDLAKLAAPAARP